MSFSVLPHLGSLYTGAQHSARLAHGSETLTVLLALGHQLHIFPWRQPQQELHRLLPSQVPKWRTIHLPGKGTWGETGTGATTCQTPDSAS